MNEVITIYRLKSDNFNTYVSEAAYEEIKLSMSTGDHSCHKYKRLKVTPDQLQTIMYHQAIECKNNIGFVSLHALNPNDNDDKLQWFYYDGYGDCVIYEMI